MVPNKPWSWRWHLFFLLDPVVVLRCVDTLLSFRNILWTYFRLIWHAHDERCGCDGIVLVRLCVRGLRFDPSPAVLTPKHVSALHWALKRRRCFDAEGTFQLYSTAAFQWNFEGLKAIPNDRSCEEMLPANHRLSIRVSDAEAVGSQPQLNWLILQLSLITLENGRYICKFHWNIMYSAVTSQYVHAPT
jgi:hypothetical protein